MRIYQIYLVLFCGVLLLVGGCQGMFSEKKASLMDYDAEAKELLAKMTLDEKIGQMIQSETTGMKDWSDIETYYLGSVLAGGSADPKSGNDPASWATEFETVMAHSMKTRLKIPVLFGIDAVHGHSNIVGATIFPHNIGLGCTGSAELVEKCAHATAVEMKATGIHWAFAPCVTVPQDERWGRSYEGFSENAELVSELGAAAVKGLQGDGLAASDSVLSCAKHFAGDGGTAVGSSTLDGGIMDQGDTRCDEEVFRAIHLKPYGPAIAAGTASIMPSYSSWNGLKCSASKYLLTDVLKKELGFDGFLISDYEAIKQIDPDFKKAIGISVNAGMDMAMEPGRYREFFKNLKELVEEGTVPMSRIDDAVTRILRVKIAMGMMADGYDYHADRAKMAVIGCKEHREIARQAVRESLVLLKNDDKLLPLDKGAGKVFVAGVSADNIGDQCGGWTIDWQGRSGDITDGTTLLEAVKATVSEDTEVVYSAGGEGAKGADVAIVVVGEKPYAEMRGDRANLVISEEDKSVVRKVKASGVPMVVVLYSGRPIVINDILGDSDAFVAGWLPGTEGEGLTDVLFGDYGSSGKLSFTWPRDMSQVPINVGDGKADALFEYGFGLETFEK